MGVGLVGTVVSSAGGEERGGANRIAQLGIFVCFISADLMLLKPCGVRPR